MPRTASTVLLGLALAPVLTAQTTTIPTGYRTTEAPLNEGGVATNFLSHPSFYGQFATESYTGQPRSLKGLSLRQDGEFFAPFLPARAWSNIEIQVAETDLATFRTTFGANYKSAPVVVFSQAVNLPAPTAPNQMPMAFRATGLDFPFVTNFSYSGTKDLLISFKGTGGTLNGGPWPAPFPYPLDGVTWVPSNGGSSQFAHRGCVVSGQTQAFRSGFTQLAFAKRTGNPAFDDKMGTAFLIRSGPRNKTFLQAFSTMGTLRTGVDPTKRLPIDLGICNNLMVEPVGAYFNTGTTDGDGDWDSPLQLTPYQTLAPLVGLDIYTQALTTGPDFLSAASKTTIVAQPPSLGTALMFAPSAAATSGALVQVGIPILEARW